MGEPSHPERVAFEVVRRVLRVEVEHYDTDGRQGVVDALLHYPDGRVAALEVTTLAADGRQQLDALLGAEDFAWPNPGVWWWSINIGDVADLPRLRECYKFIILMCEEVR